MLGIQLDYKYIKTIMDLIFNLSLSIIIFIFSDSDRGYDIGFYTLQLDFLIKVVYNL